MGATEELEEVAFSPVDVPDVDANWEEVMEVQEVLDVLDVQELQPEHNFWVVQEALVELLGQFVCA